MELSNEKIKNYQRRLMFSRMRILMRNGFYGLLLSHMIFSLESKCQTASTDGVRIYINPNFLDELNDQELDFILMHEIMHVVLQHCLRRNDRDSLRFNIACDIVVNSNILLSNNMDLASISLNKYGPSMHTTPNGDEGFNYTAEQVYEMLPKDIKKDYWDDHSFWLIEQDNEELEDVWTKRLIDTIQAISIKDPNNLRGTLPLFVQRTMKELLKPQIDWRTILNDFVQEEINDYSFNPPDKRYSETNFFLPDFNDTDEVIKDILFMIDTSGSMSDEMITQAYSEVKGAIDQYDGKLQGWLGFFDAEVIEPKAFIDEQEFKTIKPLGGGGTDFKVIFDYVNQHMQDNLPSCIIILTDGYAPFPKENITNNIPVLWLINNDEITPTWGKIARIKS